MEICHYTFNRITLDPNKYFGKWRTMYSRIADACGFDSELFELRLEGAIIGLEDATLCIRQLPIYKFLDIFVPIKKGEKL